MLRLSEWSAGVDELGRGGFVPSSFTDGRTRRQESKRGKDPSGHSSGIFLSHTCRSGAKFWDPKSLLTESFSLMTKVKGSRAGGAKLTDGAGPPRSFRMDGRRCCIQERTWRVQGVGASTASASSHTRPFQTLNN